MDRNLSCVIDVLCIYKYIIQEPVLCDWCVVYLQVHYTGTWLLWLMCFVPTSTLYRNLTFVIDVLCIYGYIIQEPVFCDWCVVYLRVHYTGTWLVWLMCCVSTSTLYRNLTCVIDVLCIYEYIIQEPYFCDWCVVYLQVHYTGTWLLWLMCCVSTSTSYRNLTCVIDVLCIYEYIIQEPDLCDWCVVYLQVHYTGTWLVWLMCCVSTSTLYRNLTCVIDVLCTYEYIIQEPDFCDWCVVYLRVHYTGTWLVWLMCCVSTSTLYRNLTCVIDVLCIYKYIIQEPDLCDWCVVYIQVHYTGTWLLWLMCCVSTSTLYRNLTCVIDVSCIYEYIIQEPDLCDWCVVYLRVHYTGTWLLWLMCCVSTSTLYRNLTCVIDVLCIYKYIIQEPDFCDWCVVYLRVHYTGTWLLWLMCCVSTSTLYRNLTFVIDVLCIYKYIIQEPDFCDWCVVYLRVH